MERKACSKSVNRIVLAILMIVFLSAVIGYSSANVYNNPISENQTDVKMTCSEACKIIGNATITDAQCRGMSPGNPVCDIVEEGVNALCDWCCESPENC